jgi:arginine-tRNA-protein transferase
MSRLNGGWRRFGYTIFRPQCPSCRMCQSLRVPVATFRPDRSQRRAWTANHQAVSLEIGTPSRSDAKEALREAFQRYQHEDKAWPLETADYDEMFVENPFHTEEWCYYLGDRLIAVGYVDRLPEGLSAIYFYYDPAERHRSLGTFNVLAVIAAARRASNCRTCIWVTTLRDADRPNTKRVFRPNEVLSSSGAWMPFSASQS